MRTYAAVVVLLFVQIALRVHHPTALPVFVDEYNHIRRAMLTYGSDQIVIRQSHGKLLFYYYLGLFDPTRENGLALSRMAVSLFSLVGSAAAAATARDLMGRRAVIPAMAFYALAPYALFFERMALADPFAGSLTALAVWSSIRLARRPSILWGLICGALFTLATMAKLTTAPTLALIPLAALLFSDFAGGVSRWKEYREAWILAGTIFAAGWGVIIADMLVDRLIWGNKPFLMDTYLVESHAQRLSDKLAAVPQHAIILLSAPMCLILIGLAVLLLVVRRRVAIFLLAWLLLLWIPSTVLIITVQSRYLMTGIPALAAIFGGGIAALGEHFRQKRRLNDLLVAGVLIFWAAGFALPFARDAMTDPAALSLPDRDIHDYFAGDFNGWGVRDTLVYLRKNGIRDDSGRVPVIAVVQHCGVPVLYLDHDFDWTCYDPWDLSYRWPPRISWDWPAIIHLGGDDRPVVYLITEFDGDLASAGHVRLWKDDWLRVTSFKRPHGGHTVTVWQVTGHFSEN